MPNQEFAVFFGEDVIRDRSEAQTASKMAAELKHQRSFSTPNRPSDANGKSAAREIAIKRLVAIVKVAGMIQVLVSVAMVSMVVRM